MKRGTKLAVIISFSLFLLVLTTVALRGGDSLASVPYYEAPKNLSDLEQSESTPQGVAAYKGISAGWYPCYFPFANHDPSDWSTELFFQNISDDNMAHVTVTLYSKNGDLAHSETYTLPPRGRGSSVVSDVTEGDSFTGAAVVRSPDQELACSAEVFKSDDYSSDLMAYRALGSSSRWVAPQIRKEDAGWNSRIFIYNPVVSQVVSISFYNHVGTLMDTVSKTLNTNETWIYNVENSDNVPPSGFDGWAEVRGNQSIAAVVLNENQSDGGAVAFTSTPWDWSGYSSENVLPWVKRNSTTEVSFYNGGSISETMVWMGYYAASDGTEDYSEEPSLAPYAKLTRNLDDLPLPTSDWSGSVVAYTSYGGSMTALTDWGSAASGYSSFPFTGAEQSSGPMSPNQSWQFWLPNIYRHPHKFTAFNIWSAEGEVEGNVTVDFYDTEGNLVASYGESPPANASIRFDQGDMPELGINFEGSVYISANAHVVVVEEKVLDSPPPQDPYEYNDHPEEAYTLTLPHAPLTDPFIGHEHDPDWYKFTITEPSLITVTLGNLPHNYDVVLFDDLLTTPTVPITNDNIVCDLIDGASVNERGEVETAPWLSSPWLSSPWLSSPWLSSPWLSSPWLSSPWLSSPWLSSQWRAGSAESGTQTESISTIAFHQGTYYVLVFPAEEEYSVDPYSLEVQTQPLSDVTGVCEWTLEYPDVQPTEVYTGATVDGDEPWTLILYNKTRLDHTYGYTEGNAISDTLGTLADLDSVRGLVVPVDGNEVVSATYTDWSSASHYCDVDKANAVADAIRDEIISPTLAAHEAISYVVLIGDDAQIPFYRTPDRNAISNERDYGMAMEKNTKMQALRAALWKRYFLTDNFYGVPPGGELYCRDPIWLSSLVVGRLVETPDEIMGLIHGYVTSDTLTATTGLATGYDFFTDCGEAISDTFGGQGLDTTPLVSEMWDADDLATAWLTDTPDLASINAHFNHWGTLPAKTTHSNPYVESSKEVSATDALSGLLGFSIGCHSGLPVPDDDVTDTTTSPDYPQVLARKGGYWVGNTGYGYGMSDSIDGSEKLMWYFAQELGREKSMPAGEALMRAKRRYFGNTASGGLSDIHRKALQEATFYGLPMYQVSVPNLVTPSIPISSTQSAPHALNGDWDLYGVTITVQSTLTQRSSSAGLFYSVGDETQGSPGRPIQPLGYLPLASNSYWHGAMLVGGAFEDHSGFDPVVARPFTATNRLGSRTEPPFNLPGWFPDQPFMINRFGGETQLVIVPGQFNQDGDIERLYSWMMLAAYYSNNNDDYTPPTIWGVTTSTVDGGWNIDVHVTDSSGVQRAVVTYEGNSWETLDLTKESGASNHWTGMLGDTEDTSFFVQAVDKAGNVALATNKGLYFALGSEDVSTPIGGLTEWPTWRSMQTDTQIPYLPLILREN